MTYTIEDIKEAWEAYKGQKVLSFVDGGVDKFLLLTGKRIEPPPGAQRVKQTDLKSVMSFPRYLETRWRKDEKQS